MPKKPFLAAAGAIVAVAALVLAALAGASASSSKPFLSGLTKITSVASTVPANGDVNPYGIVRVPSSAGKLHAGDILVSNFNAKSNNQGTGTTIVELTPHGKVSLFSQISAAKLPGSCPGGVGLTTALAVIPGNYVVVGSLPTANGKSATAKAGCLIVLDPSGKPISTIAGSDIQGPWDMASVAHGHNSTLFVSTALNGGAQAGRHTIDNATVVRIDLTSSAGQTPAVRSMTVIANRIPRRNDPNALVIGPTGVALASNGTLYVNDTLDNRIAAIPNAMTRTTAAADAGSTVFKGGALKQPLGLTLAPNGDLVAANAGDGNMVEVSPAGKQVAVKMADTKTGAGSLFGLFVAHGGRGIYYVDDGDNTVKFLH